MKKALPSWKKVLETERKPRRLLRLAAEGLALEPYHHWETIESLDPPSKLNTEQWWTAIKLQRAGISQRVNLPGEQWLYTPTASILRSLDHLMALASGPADPSYAERFRISALTDEAIHSCRLDGILVPDDHATRHAIRGNKPPVEAEYRAAWNLFRLLQNIHAGHLLQGPLRQHTLREVATALTEGTRDEGASEREHSDQEFAALEDLFQQTEPFSYLPPLVRATATYAWFWHSLIELPHGGRFARLLHHWACRRLGIPLVFRLAWSRILTKTPKKGRRALRHTLSDENDLTYFLLYHLKTLEEALAKVETRMAKKRSAEEALSITKSRRGASLNERQRALLLCASKRPQTDFTIAIHQAAHGIVYETARTDLAELAEKGFLVKEKVQRTFVYRVTKGRARP